MDPREKVFIILHETVLQSWLKDFGSLGSLALLIFVNHRFGSGSTTIDIFGLFLLVLWFMKTGRRETDNPREMTRDELREWANKREATTVRVERI